MERESRPPHTLPPLPPDVIDTEIAYLTERRRLVFGEPREHAPTGSPPASPPADAAPAGADRAASDDHTRALGELFKGAHAFKSFGLALSGGGIRSATFNLGLPPGLAGP